MSNDAPAMSNDAQMCVVVGFHMGNLVLVPYVEGVVEFAKDLIGCGEQKGGQDQSPRSAALSAREAYARRYLATKVNIQSAIDLCWPSVHMHQLFAWVAGVSEPDHGLPSEYELKKEVIVDSSDRAARVTNPAYGVDWCIPDDYARNRLVQDSAAVGWGDYVVLARKCINVPDS